ncbi:MAG: hypothetical protein BWY57_02728 [Betaproteobacteria bacterium ADurb.Bin341]|nr:MAG: hypothetical protein BWY57_02728 [Betaproteobacteria bacterium ADurb.Bin341]
MEKVIQPSLIGREICSRTILPTDSIYQIVRIQELLCHRSGGFLQILRKGMRKPKELQVLFQSALPEK